MWGGNYLSSHLSTTTLVQCSKRTLYIYAPPGAEKPVLTVAHGWTLKKGFASPNQ